MRLVTVRLEDETAAGRVEGREVVLLPYSDVGDLLRDDQWQSKAGAPGPMRTLDSVSLAAPVQRPGKIICLGLNYETHILEMGRELPRYPTLFSKFASALVGPADPIILPLASEQVDWEAELAFFVGATARHVNAEEALSCIAGWTAFNDVSIRDYQNRTTQYLAGKTFEATNPVGPALVTSDELPPDGKGLRIRCSVDDVVVQDASTSDLLFKPSQVVAYLSEFLTLEPGDLIATGTPGGVASGRTPPPWLRPGQILRTDIEGVGQLENRCEAELGGSSAPP